MYNFFSDFELSAKIKEHTTYDKKLCETDDLSN